MKYADMAQAQAAVLIAEMEKGHPFLPFLKPGDPALVNGLPYNPTTGRAYRGGNEFPASPQGYGALRCRRPGIESAAGLFVYDLLQAGVLPRTRHAGLDIRIRGAVPDGVDEYHAGRV